MPDRAPHPSTPHSTPARRPLRRGLRVVASAALAGSLVLPATVAQAAVTQPATEAAPEVAADVTPAPTAAPAAAPTAAATTAPTAAAATAPTVAPTAAPAPAAVAPTAAPSVAPAAPATTAATTAQAVDVDTDPFTAAIHGRVTDSTGAPIPDYGVIVHGADPTMQVRPDGTWSAEEMQSGWKLVRILVPDARGKLVQIFWDGSPHGTHGFSWAFDQAEGQVDTGIDVALVDNTATGRVTAGGEPVAGAKVQFFLSRESTSPARTVGTDEDGTWFAGWVCPDEYAIRVVPPAGSGLAPAWLTPDGMIEFGTTPRTISGLDVDLQGESRVSGRVVDAAGSPAKGQKVTLWRGPVPVRSVAETVTAADGTYSFGEVDQGSYTVGLTGPTRNESSYIRYFLGGALQAASAQWVQVGPQQAVTLDDLVGHRGGTVYGDVVSEGAWRGVEPVIEFVAADGSVAVTAQRSYYNDELVEFGTAGPLPVGRYRVRATLDGGGRVWVGGNSAESARVFDVRAGGSIRDAELVLSDEFLEAPPQPTIELTDANRGGLGVTGQVAPGGTVALTGLVDAGSSYVWLFSTPQALGYARAVADGTRQVAIPAGAAPGAHRLVVTDVLGTVVGWTDVTVAAPAPAVAPVVPAAPSAAAPSTAAPSAAAPSVAATPAAARARAPRTAVLAATGAQVAWLAGGAGALLLAGAGLLVLRRRRAA